MGTRKSAKNRINVKPPRDSTQKTLATGYTINVTDLWDGGSTEIKVRVFSVGVENVGEKRSKTAMATG